MKLHQNYRAIDFPKLYSIKPKGLAVEFYWYIQGIFIMRKASKYISKFTIKILKSDTLERLYKL